MTKLKTLATSVAVALGAATAAHAAPVTLAFYNANSAQFAKVDISGASAQEDMIELSMGLLCKTDTLAAYRGVAGSNVRLMLCEVDTTKISTLSKPYLIVRKSSIGGSGNGVQPVADGTPVGFMNPATSVCPVLPGTPNVDLADPLIDFYRVTCTASPVENAVPRTGLSDVEPALFGATEAQLGNLVISPTNDLVFGVAVNTKLRNRLQTAQGLTSGSEALADMPSLTFEHVTGLFSANIKKWDQLSDTSGVKLNNPLLLTPSGIEVNICRRVASSGSQKTTEVVFLNNPCAADAALSMPTQDGINVFEGSGSGNVRACLASRDDENQYAIGLLSTESVPALADKYRYVKIDGNAPNLLNTTQSDYKFWATNTLQYNANISGDPLEVSLKLVSSLQNVDVVKEINKLFVMWKGTANEWDGGYLTPTPNADGTLPTAPSAAPAGILTAAEVRANPVNATSKQLLGDVKNCQLPAPAELETSVP